MFGMPSLACLTSPREKRMVGEALAQLPRYQCHKQVRAVKIRAIVHGRESSDLLPFDTALPVVTVDPDWINKHEPEAGGYFVLYDDGYQSYSPAGAFEAGYTLAASIPDRLAAIADELRQLTQNQTKELPNLAVIKALDNAAAIIRASAEEFTPVTDEQRLEWLRRNLESQEFGEVVSMTQPKDVVAFRQVIDDLMASS